MKQRLTLILTILCATALLATQVPDEEQREQHDRNDQKDIHFHHMQEMHHEGDDSGYETGNSFPFQL